MKLGYPFGIEDSDWYVRLLFGCTMAIMVGLGGFGLAYPGRMSHVLTAGKTWVLTNFGWWFILLGFVLLVSVVAFVSSSYGTIRIGGPDTTPEFSRFAWLSMVFTVGFGASILIWGVSEPISIVQSPPPSPMPVQGASRESMALAFMFIHEVFPGLAMWYLPVAIAFGITVYTRGVAEYRISSLFDGALMGRSLPAWFGSVRPTIEWCIDAAAVIATIGGIATTLGFSAQTMAAILGRVFGTGSTLITYAVFGLIALVFLLDVWLGLRSGIRNAARATMVLIGVSMAVLVLAPTVLTWIQHSLIGGWVLAPGYQEPIAQAMAESGKPAAIAEALSITPMGTVLAVLFVLVIAGYIITSLDSAVFMIAAITLGTEDPNPRNRAWWGLLLAVFGAMSLQLSKFSAIESLSVIMALPFSVLLLIMVYASYVEARAYREGTESSGS